ncbi:MAG: D-alanine--D-alanine ligase [Cytophagaceae bacterium]|nr:D-alanine--D-alanine ligase [Cytophagaceae bacterium]
MKIGIFFGGPAREREISFLGGQTVFAQLDRSLFEPIPIFLDGRGNFIVLHPELMHAESIRDFYPPAGTGTPGGFTVYDESLGELPEEQLDVMIRQVGHRISPPEFRQHFDFAFLIVHGPGLEDGAIQGLLEWYGVPYYGSGLMGSGIGIDKIAQNELIRATVGLDKKTAVLTKDQWDSTDHQVLFDQLKTNLGLPFVAKAPHQGSSIGVSFIKTDDLAAFERAIQQCLFQDEIRYEDWANVSEEQKHDRLQKLANFDEGIAFPLVFNGETVHHPQMLRERLDAHFAKSQTPALLTSVNREDAVLFEAFVNGQEFSCGVIQDFDGTPVALPPTEVVKDEEIMVFDFKTKYKTSTTRKNIPIDTSLETNQLVQKLAREVFGALKFGACTRIDGFVTPDGRVLLHDPNTLPGMSPVSLIFKQMAQIGFTVTDALTYFIRTSLRERIREGKNTTRYEALLQDLDARIQANVAARTDRQRVALVFGENDDEFAETKKYHTRLACAGTYTLLPVLALRGDGNSEAAQPTFFAVPPHFLMKDTVAELKAALDAPIHPLILETRQNARAITQFFTGGSVADVRRLDTLSEAADSVWAAGIHPTGTLPGFAP